MNKGDLFKHEFTIDPCEGGSFLVYVKNVGNPATRYAFSNVTDLLRWLQDHAYPKQQVQPPAHAPSLKESLMAKYNGPVREPVKPLPLPGPSEVKIGDRKIRWPFRL